MADTDNVLPIEAANSKNTQIAFRGLKIMRFLETHAFTRAVTTVTAVALTVGGMSALQPADTTVAVGTHHDVIVAAGWGSDAVWNTADTGPGLSPRGDDESQWPWD